MKKMVMFLLVALVMSSQMVVGQDEISAGNVRTDGYGKITHGAFWSIRPEAKMISEGSIPPGCKVYTLSEEYFVRFIDDEHNNQDVNYIVFPVGSKVYTKDGFWYSVICGNRIEYIRPVTQVKIIEKEKIVEKLVPAPAPKDEPKAPPVEIQDTIVHTTYIEENNIRRNNYLDDDIYYRPMPMMYWVTPILAGGYYGQSQMVDQRQYNYYSSQTNNYVCERSTTRPEHHQPKPEAPHASGPGGRGDDNNHASGPGGRGDGATGGNTGSSGGRDDGGHASGPDGNSNGNYNSGGPGGRSASVTRDRMGRITSSQVQTASGLKSASVNNNNRNNTTRSSRSANYQGSSRQTAYNGARTNYRPSYNSASSRGNSSSFRTSSYGGASRSSYSSASAPRQSSYSRPSYGGGSRSSSMGRR